MAELTQSAPTANVRPLLDFLTGAMLVAVRIAILASFLICWEMSARFGLVSPFVLPRFTAVIGYIYTDAMQSDLLGNILVTLHRAISGFLIASALGITIGVGIARIGFVRWFFDPVISFAFPMPKIAFLPIIILWLGVYDVSKITMIVFDSIFPVITATAAGLSAVDKHLIWSAQSVGAGRHRMLFNIYIPAALPAILTGMQVAIPIALIVTIVCEMLMGGYGLGGKMIAASRFSDATGVFAGIVESAVLGWFLIQVMSLLRQRLLRWHQETLMPMTV